MPSIQINFPEHYGQGEIEELLKRLHMPLLSVEEQKKTVERIGIESRLLNKVSQEFQELSERVATLENLLSKKKTEERELGEVLEKIEKTWKEAINNKRTLGQHREGNKRRDSRMDDLQKQINGKPE